MSNLSTFGSSALHVIESLAPTVATALGGPFAGTAVVALEKALGVTGKESVESAIMTANPETLLKLKEAELELQKTLSELKIQQEALEYGDVKSARERDMAYVANHQRNYRADVLAYGALVAFVAAGWALFAKVLPPENRELIVYLLGALTVIVKDIYGFEFGSSKASQDKSETIAELSASKK
jgi:hypothetical protein